MTEQQIQQHIRLTCSTGATRLFRNNTGTLKDQHGRPVQFGLCKGSADLIGWRTVTVTPEMVGTTVAVFTSIEVKTATGRLRPEQQQWLDAVQAAGGIAGVARSVEDAQRLTTTAVGGTLREPQTESHDDHDTCPDRSAAAPADHHHPVGY
jgi:hypothetical protein